MAKRLKYLFMLMALVALVTSCTKDPELMNPNAQSNADTKELRMIDDTTDPINGGNGSDEGTSITDDDDDDDDSESSKKTGKGK